MVKVRPEFTALIREWGPFDRSIPLTTDASNLLPGPGVRQDADAPFGAIESAPAQGGKAQTSSELQLSGFAAPAIHLAHAEMTGPALPP